MGLGILVFTLSLTAKEHIIMTINGEDVSKSEFEYLYHKNNSLLTEPQSLEDYVDLFVIYKLKVADAKESGLDTTLSFRHEMEKYRKDLSYPYLIDSVFINTLVEEIIGRSREDVETSHIMVLKSEDPVIKMKNRNLIDSIRSLALNGADFGELAMTFSADQSAKNNRGSLGYISQGQYPYNFESAAYSTPAGSISEVVESQVGYHTIKTGDRRPAKGKVKVSHIMKLVPPNVSETDETIIKEKIDSIYAIVSQYPSKFTSLARSESDDTGSAGFGGALPKFGIGEMVPEFEDVAFALPEGHISKPFRSVYGWHIILKNENIPFPSESEVKESVERALANPRDDRYYLMKAHVEGRLQKKHDGYVNNGVVEEMCNFINSEGGEKLRAVYSDGVSSMEPLISVAGETITVKDFFNGVTNIEITSSDKLKESIHNLYRQTLLDTEENWLYENVEAYRHLLDEYRDGSLLYEMSLKKIWDPASEDTFNLLNYFENHKDKYKWEAPKVKGYLVSVESEEWVEPIRESLENSTEEEIMSIISEEFQDVAKVVKILVSKGSNPTVDSLAFEGKKVIKSDSKFPFSFLISGRVLLSPEIMDDVRNQVVADLQDELEKQWVMELKKKYPVKIYSKVLKNVK